MGFTFYPPEIATHALLAFLPAVLITAVARRMRRGLLVASLPWLLVLAATVLYAPAAIQVFGMNGLRGTWLMFLHLSTETALPITILSLAVLAVLGVKIAPEQSEPR